MFALLHVAKYDGDIFIDSKKDDPYVLLEKPEFTIGTTDGVLLQLTNEGVILTNTIADMTSVKDIGFAMNIEQYIKIIDSLNLTGQVNTSNIDVHGISNVNGKSTFLGNVILSQDVAFNNAFSINTLQSEWNTNIIDDMHISKNLYIKNDATLVGDIIVASVDSRMMNVGFDSEQKADLLERADGHVYSNNVYCKQTTDVIEYTTNNIFVSTTLLSNNVDTYSTNVNITSYIKDVSTFYTVANELNSVRLFLEDLHFQGPLNIDSTNINVLDCYIQGNTIIENDSVIYSILSNKFNTSNLITRNCSIQNIESLNVNAMKSLAFSTSYMNNAKCLGNLNANTIFAGNCLSANEIIANSLIFNNDSVHIKGEANNESGNVTTNGAIIDNDAKTQNLFAENGKTVTFAMQTANLQSFDIICQNINGNNINTLKTHGTQLIGNLANLMSGVLGINDNIVSRTTSTKTVNTNANINNKDIYCHNVITTSNISTKSILLEGLVASSSIVDNMYVSNLTTNSTDTKSLFANHVNNYTFTCNNIVTYQLNANVVKSLHHSTETEYIKNLFCNIATIENNTMISNDVNTTNILVYSDITNNILNTDTLNSNTIMSDYVYTVDSKAQKCYTYAASIMDMGINNTVHCDMLQTNFLLLPELYSTTYMLSHNWVLKEDLEILGKYINVEQTTTVYDSNTIYMGIDNIHSCNVFNTNIADISIINANIINTNRLDTKSDATLKFADTINIVTPTLVTIGTQDIHLLEINGNANLHESHANIQNMFTSNIETHILLTNNISTHAIVNNTNLYSEYIYSSVANSINVNTNSITSQHASIDNLFARECDIDNITCSQEIQGNVLICNDIILNEGNIKTINTNNISINNMIFTENQIYLQNADIDCLSASCNDSIQQNVFIETDLSTQIIDCNVKIDVIEMSTEKIITNGNFNITGRRIYFGDDITFVNDFQFSRTQPTYKIHISKDLTCIGNAKFTVLDIMNSLNMEYSYLNTVTAKEVVSQEVFCSNISCLENIRLINDHVNLSGALSGDSMYIDNGFIASEALLTTAQFKQTLLTSTINSKGNISTDLLESHKLNTSQQTTFDSLEIDTNGFIRAPLTTVHGNINALNLSTSGINIANELTCNGNGLFSRLTSPEVRDLNFVKTPSTEGSLLCNTTIHCCVPESGYNSSTFRGTSIEKEELRIPSQSSVLNGNIAYFYESAITSTDYIDMVRAYKLIYRILAFGDFESLIHRPLILRIEELILVLDKEFSLSTNVIRIFKDLNYTIYIKLRQYFSSDRTPSHCYFNNNAYTITKYYFTNDEFQIRLESTDTPLTTYTDSHAFIFFGYMHVDLPYLETYATIRCRLVNILNTLNGTTLGEKIAYCDSFQFFTTRPDIINVSVDFQYIRYVLINGKAYSAYCDKPKHRFYFFAPEEFLNGKINQTFNLIPYFVKQTPKPIFSSLINTPETNYIREQSGNRYKNYPIYFDRISVFKYYNAVLKYMQFMRNAMVEAKCPTYFKNVLTWDIDPSTLDNSRIYLHEKTIELGFPHTKFVSSLPTFHEGQPPNEELNRLDYRNGQLILHHLTNMEIDVYFNQSLPQLTIIPMIFNTNSERELSTTYTYEDIYKNNIFYHIWKRSNMYGEKILVVTLARLITEIHTLQPLQTTLIQHTHQTISRTNLSRNLWEADFFITNTGNNLVIHNHVIPLFYASYNHNNHNNGVQNNVKYALEGVQNKKLYTCKKTNRLTFVDKLNISRYDVNSSRIIVNSYDVNYTWDILPNYSIAHDRYFANNETIEVYQTSVVFVNWWRHGDSAREQYRFFMTLEAIPRRYEVFHFTTNMSLSNSDPRWRIIGNPPRIIKRTGVTTITRTQTGGNGTFFKVIRNYRNNEYFDLFPHVTHNLQLYTLDIIVPEKPADIIERETYFLIWAKGGIVNPGQIHDDGRRLNVNKGTVDRIRSTTRDDRYKQVYYQVQHGNRNPPLLQDMSNWGRIVNTKIDQRLGKASYFVFEVGHVDMRNRPKPSAFYVGQRCDHSKLFTHILNRRSDGRYEWIKSFAGSWNTLIPMDHEFESLWTIAYGAVWVTKYGSDTSASYHARGVAVEDRQGYGIPARFNFP
jgi:hypothetical protein